MPRFLPFILLCLIAWDRAQACTKEFKPVCGYWMHSPRTQTFPNRCQMAEAGALWRHDGTCQDKAAKPASAKTTPAPADKKSAK
jgi:hypothetical protein